MRLALLGATGRTGRHVLACALAAGHRVRVLVRGSLPPQEGVEVVTGDCLDPTALRRLVAGTDAVICALGPVPSSPADVCSRSTRLLVDAMKEAGVRRLVVQTGALIGHPHLGPFYRWMARRKGLAGTLAERRAQERAVQDSGLDWTLLRPPRLTEGRGTGAVAVGPALKVSMLAKVARADLAARLVEAATSSRWTRTGVTALQGFTSARPWVALTRRPAHGGALAAAVAGARLRAAPLTGSAQRRQRPEPSPDPGAAQRLARRRLRPMPIS